MTNEFSKKIWKVFVLIGIAVICVSACGTKHVEKDPDIYSSMRSNCDEHLIIIANREVIEDKNEFAKLLVQKCKDNSFESIKFSTDFGYATSLDMDVYLWKEEVKGYDPVMNVKYKPILFGKDYDIVNHPEMFELFVDGEKIE